MSLNVLGVKRLTDASAAKAIRTSSLNVGVVTVLLCRLAQTFASNVTYDYIHFLRSTTICFRILPYIPMRIRTKTCTLQPTMTQPSPYHLTIKLQAGRPTDVQAHVKTPLCRKRQCKMFL
jgi:hypothetical protein